MYLFLERLLILISLHVFIWFLFSFMGNLSYGASNRYYGKQQIYAADLFILMKFVNAIIYVSICKPTHHDHDNLSHDIINSYHPWESVSINDVLLGKLVIP